MELFYKDQNNQYKELADVDGQIKFKAFGMIPTHIQEMLTVQTKEQTGVSVGAGASLTVATVQMAGFAKLGVGVSCSTSHNYTLNIITSPDGTARYGYLGQITSTTFTKQQKVDSTLDVVILEIVNNDAAGKTYDVYTRKSNA